MNIPLKNPFIVLLSLIILFSACSGGQEEKTVEAAAELPTTVVLTDAQRNNIVLKTGPVKRQAVSAVLKTHGLIDVPPQNMVSISVPLGGYLKESHLLPGTHVRKGERIAVIEDQQYIQLQQDYLTAVARLTYSEEEYKRQRELNAGKATSDKAYQQVVADYKAQKVEVKGLSEKLELIGIDPHALTEESLSRNVSISSPIDGYVTRVNANIGKYVRPEDVLFELVNPSDIHLDLKVFEKDIEDVHIGQEVTAYTNNRPDRKYKCEVILVGKDLTEDRALEVHCHFENGDPSLIPGLYMNAEITVSKGDAYVIPSDAVVTHDNKSYVFRVIADNRFERVEVSTGATMDGIVEVEWKGGAPAESDVFVTEGAYALLMTMMNVADE